MISPLDYTYITSSDRGTEIVPLDFTPQEVYLLFMLVSNIYETRFVAFENVSDYDELETFLTELLDKLMSKGEEQDMWNIGDYKEISHDTIPDKWLLCEGQSLVRADYTELFDLIGTTYGSVDSTHFNIPDFRMRSSMGAGALGGNDELYGTFPIGFSTGDLKNIILVENLPAHHHGYGTTAASGTVGTDVIASSGVYQDNDLQTKDTGGGLGFSVLHPVTITNRIIKVLP